MYMLYRDAPVHFLSECQIFPLNTADADTTIRSDYFHSYFVYTFLLSALNAPVAQPQLMHMVPQPAWMAYLGILNN